VFLLLGGIVSEPATTERLVDGGILAACLAEAWGARFCFGNDDCIERSLGRRQGRLQKFKAPSENQNVAQNFKQFI